MTLLATNLVFTLETSYLNSFLLTYKAILSNPVLFTQSKTNSNQSTTTSVNSTTKQVPSNLEQLQTTVEPT